jgi:RNA polymerase sigma factor (sigma-70 family)
MSDNDHASGESAEWIEQALQRYERPLVRYTARITSDPEPARDIVQDAFLQLCRADRARVEGRLAAWLFTVCRNGAVDYRRKVGRMVDLDCARDLAATAAESLPGEVAVRHDEHTQLLRALGELPTRQQEVIRLRFQDGLSYKEISQVTGLSVSNVGYLMHVGLKAVRERLLTHAGSSPAEQRSKP